MLQVSNATAQGLPPSSLLLWNRVVPDADAVYLGDFDTEFQDPFFWSFKDVSAHSFSNVTIARAAVVLARALLDMATDGAPAAQAKRAEVCRCARTYC